MGGTLSLPENAIAPQPARVLRRADLAREEIVRGLAAEMWRLFVDAGGVDEGEPVAAPRRSNSSVRPSHALGTWLEIPTC
jgi:hypothetical protein